MDAIVSKLCPAAAYGSGTTRGRRAFGSTLNAASGPFWIRKIKLTGGFDPGGAFWGDPPAPGVDLYGYLSTNGTISGFKWAMDRAQAKRAVRLDYPNAKWA